MTSFSEKTKTKKTLSNLPSLFRLLLSFRKKILTLLTVGILLTLIFNCDCTGSVETDPVVEKTVITNDILLYSSNYFQTIGNNFHKYTSNFHYQLISDDTGEIASNYYSSLVSINMVSVTVIKMLLPFNEKVITITTDNGMEFGITCVNSRSFKV